MNATTESRFDFPCPHCGKETPVVMTVSGGVPKAMVTTIVHSENCTIEVGTEEDNPGDDLNIWGEPDGFCMEHADHPAHGQDYIPSPEQVARFDAYMGAGAAAFVSGTQWSPAEQKALRERAAKAGPDGIVELPRGMSLGEAASIIKPGQAFSVGTIPAGVEIDAAGAWLDKMMPPASPEVRDAIMASVASSGMAATMTTFDDETGKVSVDMVDPRENRGSVEASVGTTERKIGVWGSYMNMNLTEPMRFGPLVMPEGNLAKWAISTGAVIERVAPWPEQRLTGEMVSAMADYAKAYGSSFAGFKAVVEQVARLNGREVIVTENGRAAWDLTMLVAQAQQCLATAKSV